MIARAEAARIRQAYLPLLEPFLTEAPKRATHLFVPRTKIRPGVSGINYGHITEEGALYGIGVKDDNGHPVFKYFGPERYRAFVAVNSATLWNSYLEKRVPIEESQAFWAYPDNAISLRNLTRHRKSLSGFCQDKHS
jgi:hypothetical protein